MRTPIWSLLALAGLLALASASTADARRYSLAELKALVAQGSYPEAIRHLSDIGPADRTPAWVAVAVEAATAYVGGLANDDSGTKIWTIEAIDAEYPQLLRSPTYLAVRTRVGLRGYDACFAHDGQLDACIAHATKFLEADATNTNLALAMAKSLRRHSNPTVAIGFFKRAVAGTPTAATCKDDALQDTVLAGLALPTDHGGAADARAIASGACFTYLARPILAALDAEVPGGAVHVNTCPLMKAKRALDATQARSCDKKGSRLSPP